MHGLVQKQLKSAELQDRASQNSTVWIYLVGIDENEIGHTYIDWVTFSQVWILAMPEIIMQVTSQLAYKLPYFSHNIFQFLFYLSLNKSC